MSNTTPIRVTTLQDIPVIYDYLRIQNKEAYTIRNERAWKTMATMLCEERGDQLSTVYQIDGNVVGFYSAILDPSKFWKTFIKRYGFFRFVWEKMRQTAELQEKKNVPKPVIEGHPIDTEFLEKAQKRYDTVPGKAYQYYVYVAPEARNVGVARKLLGDVEGRLKNLRCKTLESEILTDNEASIKLHASLGFDIRSIGDMWYMVKHL